MRPPAAPPLANTSCHHPLLTTSLTPILLRSCKLPEHLLTSTATHPGPFVPETCASPSSFLCNAGFRRTPPPPKASSAGVTPIPPKAQLPTALSRGAPRQRGLPLDPRSLHPLRTQSLHQGLNSRLPQPVFLISPPGVHLRGQTPYPGFKSPWQGVCKRPFLGS